MGIIERSLCLDLNQLSVPVKAPFSEEVTALYATSRKCKAHSQLGPHYWRRELADCFTGGLLQLLPSDIA